MEIGSIETTRALVKLGVGVGILPPWACEHELTSGAIQMRPMGARGLRRRWSVVHRADRRLGLPEEQLLKLLGKQASLLRLDWRDLAAASKAGLG